MFSCNLLKSVTCWPNFARWTSFRQIFCNPMKAVAKRHTMLPFGWQNLFFLVKLFKPVLILIVQVILNKLSKLSPSCIESSEFNTFITDRRLKPPERSKRAEKVLLILQTSPSTQIRRRLTEGARVISFVRIDNNIFRRRYFRSDLLTARDRVHLIQSQCRQRQCRQQRKQRNNQVAERQISSCRDRRGTSLPALAWLSKSIAEESRDSWELRVADVVGVSSSSKSLTDFTMGSFLWMSRGRGRKESLLIFSSQRKRQPRSRAPAINRRN